MSEILIAADNSTTPEDNEYDSPHGSQWIVSVDDCGLVSILQRPNIHYTFFDNGEGAEEIGLPSECEDTAPGVYGWVCDFVESRDWETGVIDDWRFEVRDEVCLYSLPES